jgi:acetyl esterase/lipase
LNHKLPWVTLGLDVLEETRAVNVELGRFLSSQAPIHTFPPDVVRASRRLERGPFPAPVYLPQARWETISGRGGETRLRVLEPETETAGVYLHIHGGGWTLGAADLQDSLLWELVEAAGLTAVSVDYRLAPEHPWPACADDCEDAASWLLERGERMIAIGGESAGGHLSVVTLLRLRDRGVDVREAFAAANLVFGVFDLAGTPSRRRWGGRDPFLPSSAMDWFTDGLLRGTDLEARRDPAISPLYADLAGLPPALFTVGTRDPLLDDSLFMAARWSAAGNVAELRVWEEAVHGFTAFPTEAARRSRAEQYEFVRG